MRLIDADAAIEEFQDAIITDEYDIRNILEECPTIQIPQWISVKDRLPNTGDEVIIAVKIKPEPADKWLKEDRKKSFSCQGLLNTDGWQWCSEDGYVGVFIEDFDVTHWMPLPEPPEGDSDE